MFKGNYSAITKVVFWAVFKTFANYTPVWGYDDSISRKSQKLIFHN